MACNTCKGSGTVLKMKGVEMIKQPCPDCTPTEWEQKFNDWCKINKLKGMNLLSVQNIVTNITREQRQRLIRKLAAKFDKPRIEEVIKFMVEEW